MGGQGRRGGPRAVLWALVAGALAFALAPAAAQAAISVNDVSVGEGNGGVVATFTLTRSAGLLAAPASVSFATVDGSAHAPGDYTAISGTRDFPGSLLPETQTAFVSVPIGGDRLDEPDESFHLTVSGAEVADGDGIATIVDDDPPPVVGLADAPPATEGGSASFAVGLSVASGRDVTVAFTTANGTAIAGQDYTARAGSLTIPAGSTSATIAVPLIDDSAVEPAETFALHISAPVAATLGRSAATATILDNDVSPAPEAGPAPPASPSVTPPAPVLPSIPVTGSSVPSGVPRLGLASPRLRRPATGLVTIACPDDAGTCSGQVTLFSRPNQHSKIKELRRERRLGRRTFSLAGGATQTLTFALSRQDRRLLERAGRINVRAYAITKDSSGRSGVRTASGTLLRRTAHSSPSARR